ncbi:amino acid adenylation domain-containing protein [Streptomyces sp. NPDC051576]|uniref:amino acid adenylation domain-containing protein n=1 Tax=Streptomyces sp. NPDC051576 TaxID=3155803 RepID=UPI0034361107
MRPIEAKREPIMQGPHQPFLHAGFHASARRHPGRPALTLGDRTWTYAELDALARRWAGALRADGHRPARVGLLGHRSIVTYAGFLAALYAGATVVPLHTKYPVARNRDILERSGADALFADRGALPGLAELLSGLPAAPAVLLPESDEAPPGLPQGSRPVTAPTLADAVSLAEPEFTDPDGTAYLLFTSGSTGRPKGVPVSHHNVTSFLRASAARYDFAPEDRFSNTFDQTFDPAVFDLFMAWGHGGHLFPMDTFDLMAPLDFVRDHGITVWSSVPSVAILQHRRETLAPGSLPSLRWSLFCGEALPVTVARAWQEAADGSVLENLYGPTEATITCLGHRWDPRTSPGLAVNGVVPIGAPYPGTAAAALAEDGTELPDGETGELCVAGAQIFEGYLNAPEQTERAFHVRESGDGGRVRWYRTGDLVRRFPDGQFGYVGRLDSQVKILGHRIETGEVETHLERRPGVEQAVVLPVPGDEEGLTVLAAVLCGDGLDVAAVDEALRAALPPYMIPLTYHTLDAFPLNANGKTDRTALRERIVSGELKPFPL